MRAINPDTGEVLVLVEGQWVPEPKKSPRAVNPDTGEALILEGGKWVPETPAKPTSLAQDAGNLLAGAVRGAGSIGATLLSPLDAAARALNGGQPWNVGGYDILGQDRRKGMDEGLTSMGANPESWPYAIGKFGAEVAGRLPVLAFRSSQRPLRPGGWPVGPWGIAWAAAPSQGARLAG